LRSIELENVVNPDTLRFPTTEVRPTKVENPVTLTLPSRFTLFSKVVTPTTLVFDNEDIPNTLRSLVAVVKPRTVRLSFTVVWGSVE